MKIQLIDGVIPVRAHEGDAGLDIHSAVDMVLGLGECKTVRCGFKMALEPGFEAQIRSRSGMAAKNQVIVLNSPGTIDSGYRGEVIVILANLGPMEYHIKKGDRIAQMIIAKYETPDIKTVDNLDATARGEGGIGSTGTSKEVKK